MSMMYWSIIDSQGHTLRRCYTQRDAIAWAQAHGGMVYVCRAHEEDFVSPHDGFYKDPKRVEALGRLPALLNEIVGEMGNV